ncbi:MAG: ABC transporter substrate-binding protein, partial [Phycisphaerae bacterium]|nr:ABC transporter substrate-binding protein [Phycisphaerae bacterium]
VASLSPAVTDLILGMGLGNRLVAVSNFEPPRIETDSLPRVGDYQTVDWEKLNQLRPGMVITQYHPDKIPDGFAERCRRLGIRLFNRKVDSLTDVYSVIGELGEALDAREAAAEAQRRWQLTLDEIAARVAGTLRPRTLLVIGESGLTVAGPGTFLDNLLTVAGGRNALSEGGDYVTLDRERLAALDPDVIIQLLPAASPQQVLQAKAFWERASSLRAVREGRVVQLFDADLLLPGFSCLRTAASFAKALHGISPEVGTTRASPTSRSRLRFAPPQRFAGIPSRRELAVSPTGSHWSLL